MAPKVLKEKVLAVKGFWTFKARVSLYHHDTIRRIELLFERDPLTPAAEWDTGLSPVELQKLVDQFNRFILEEDKN